MADISTTFIEWFPTLFSTRVTLLDFDMCANELYQWNSDLVLFDVHCKKCHKFTWCLCVDLCETELAIFSVISCFAKCLRLLVYDTIHIEYMSINEFWKSQLCFIFWEVSLLYCHLLRVNNDKIFKSCILFAFLQ